ncbi:hypothetical protein AOLI_G00301510 [Acnodon oligacanthus]
MKIHSFFFFFFFHLLLVSGGDVHSFSFYFIASEGLNLPDYTERITVDDVTMFYYDSSMNGEAPCPEWLNTKEGREQWKSMNYIANYNKHSLPSALQSAILHFNLTGSSSDFNIYQGYSRCDLYPDGTRKAVFTHAFNGKDFLSFDFDRKMFIASVPQAVVYKRQRDNPVSLELVVSFYKRTCFERLKMFLQKSPGVNMKKVPDVRLFEKTKAGSELLTCHVTGFYPRDVRVEWVGAGLQSVDEDMIDVLPNGDGTYQTRRSVIRPEEKPEEHTYSCVVHHSSVAGDITKPWVREKHIGLGVWAALTCVFLAAVGTGFALRWFCKPKDVGI